MLCKSSNKMISTIPNLIAQKLNTIKQTKQNKKMLHTMGIRLNSNIFFSENQTINWIKMDFYEINYALRLSVGS